jgi:SOS-response transcriptional repressor LexA
MASRFPKGTIVITETEKQPVNGNLVVIRISGATELLAQFSAENDVAWVIPLDARHPVMRLNEGAVVCGVVTKVMVDVE